MRLRARFAIWALRTRGLAEAVLPCLVTPECSLELNHRHFSKSADRWIREAGTGLFPEEEGILEKIGAAGGRVLCLGSGGGREAFALARRGFEVVGVEPVAELVRYSRDYARAEGLAARFIRGDMTEVDLGDSRFDLIIVSNVGYSYLPSRRHRTDVLARCLRLLEPEGRCVLSFAHRTPPPLELRWRAPLRILSRLAGNPHHETGDRLLEDGNFIHFFPAVERVGDEARDAGFSRVDYFTPEGRGAYAILAP